MQPDDIRLLAAVGFVAAGRGDVARARRIFAALVRLRPQRSFAHIGWAMACLNAGRPQEALDVLSAAVEVNDPQERHELDAYRGLALQLAGHSAQSLQVLQGAGDSSLARALLGQRPPAIPHEEASPWTSATWRT